MSGNTSHGHTPAAWTGTLLILFGSLLVSVGIVIAASFLWIAGVVFVLAGIVAWIGMNRAGFGEPRR
ncbi:MAG: HGxxPAAW family protein [Dermatophilaceae bacterium]